MEKIFRTAVRMLVVIECVGTADEDGAVTITDVRQIELPTPCEVMEAFGNDSDSLEQLDKDFAEAES